MIVISTFNLEALSLLESNLFGLALFNAPLTADGTGTKIIRYGRLSNVLLEDIPQLVRGWGERAVMLRRCCCCF